MLYTNFVGEEEADEVRTKRRVTSNIFIITPVCETFIYRGEKPVTHPASDIHYRSDRSFYQAASAYSRASSRAFSFLVRFSPYQEEVKRESCERPSL